MKKQRCYIYTRVSTAMQVDGFSLDAQKEKLKKYADYQDMVVVREFSDEGKSGKNVDGRPQFKEMLELIEAGTDDIDYVLVFKFSRFGRNAADVLSSLQKMQDFGVNLICVEDGIDSSKDAGKLMISVLSAVAEIERDNILVQTMEGRKQKAREGKWNGGFAPYGYKLVDGSLFIAEDEVEVIMYVSIQEAVVNYLLFELFEETNTVKNLLFQERLVKIGIPGHKLEKIAKELEHDKKDIIPCYNKVQAVDKTKIRYEQKVAALLELNLISKGLADDLVKLYEYRNTVHIEAEMKKKLVYDLSMGELAYRRVEGLSIEVSNALEKLEST